MKNSIPQANRLAPHHPYNSIESFPDFEITHHGTISLFHPLSEQAHEWLAVHCPRGQEHQYLGKALAIERRFVIGLAFFAVYDGLTQNTRSKK